MIRSTDGEERTWNKGKRLGKAPKGRKHTGMAALSSEGMHLLLIW